MDLSVLQPFLPGQPKNFANFLDKALGVRWKHHVVPDHVANNIVSRFFFGKKAFLEAFICLKDLICQILRNAFNDWVALDIKTVIRTTS